MTDEQHLQPVPEVDEAKRRIGNDDLDLSALLAIVEAAETQVNDRRNLPVTLKDSYHLFYVKAREVLRNVEPYLLESDREKYIKHMKDTREMPKESLISIDYANELCSYVKQALKNSGLTELGRKDETPYILERINPL